MKQTFRVLTLVLAVSSSGLAQTSGVSYVIDTVAGSEVFTETGRALDTWLVGPEGVAVDALGNVYVADTIQHRILLVKPDGTIETFAGSPRGIGRFSGDNGPATEANLFGPAVSFWQQTGPCISPIRKTREFAESHRTASFPLWRDRANEVSAATGALRRKLRCTDPPAWPLIPTELSISQTV